LVVKNGSKSSSHTVGSTPTPESLTATEISPDAIARVAIRRHRCLIMNGVEAMTDVVDRTHEV